MKIKEIFISKEGSSDIGCTNGVYDREYTIEMDNGEKFVVDTCRCECGCSNTADIRSVRNAMWSGWNFKDKDEVHNLLYGGGR